MAHHLYTTKALVLRSSASGEANRFLSLFTRELGLVNALGRGIRHGKSKLRYGTQPLSFAEVTLVRGRELWRLTGAVPGFSLSTALRGERARLALASRVGQLLSRLIQGEERNEQLFDALEEGLSFLVRAELSPSELSDLECALVLRIMRELGYLGGEEFDTLLLSPFSKELLAAVSPLRSSAIMAINRSLKETHL